MRHSFVWLCLFTGFAAVPTVRADSPLGPNDGVPVVRWQDAPKLMDQRCQVVGQIVATRNIGRICFLNFDSPQTRLFTAVIRQENFARFKTPPEQAYKDKWVRVTGRVTEYRGNAQIMLAGPEQIEILSGPVDVPLYQPPAPSAPRPVGDTIKVAAYNVLNLFDGENDPYREDEGTPAKPRPELEKVATVIRKLNADLLALEEVENRDYLERFNRVLLADLGYRETVLFEGNDGRGIDCAILSRYPVGPVTSYRHLEFKSPSGEVMRFRRDLLRARIEPPGKRPFDVFVVHLKSKGGEEETDDIRVGEATAIRRILDQALAADAQARFLICGDFNDTFDSKSLKTIRGTGAGELRTFFDELAADQRVTYNKEPYRSMIDFILCSQELARYYVPKSFAIPQGTVESSGSDHNPVTASFKLAE